MKIVLPTDFNDLRDFTYALRETLVATAKQQDETPLKGWRWAQQRTYHLVSTKTPGETRISDFKNAIELTAEGINLRDLIDACHTVLKSTSTEFSALITKILKTKFHIEEQPFIDEFIRRKFFPTGLADESDIQARYAIFSTQDKYRLEFITAEKKAMAGFIKDFILPAVEATFRQLGSIPALKAAQPAVPPPQPPEPHKDQQQAAGTAEQQQSTGERRASVHSI